MRATITHKAGRPEATALGLRVWGDNGLIVDVEMSADDQLGLAAAILNKYHERRALGDKPC
jgi:hypothetical protein